MYAKAKLFKDENTAQAIKAAQTPKEAKQLGRKVKPFDVLVWDRYKYSIMTYVCFQKFHQNEQLQKVLLDSTGELVEASPNDTIWGVGLGEHDPNVLNPEKWKGTNLLGKVLTHIRTCIRTNEHHIIPMDHQIVIESLFQLQPKKKVVFKGK